MASVNFPLASSKTSKVNCSRCPRGRCCSSFLAKAKTMKIRSGFLKTYEGQSSVIRFASRDLPLFPKLTSTTDSATDDD